MISIDRQSSASVHQQLVGQLRYDIASGKYPVGSLLPSTRQLAGTLGISFHTVRKAYAELENEGLLASKPGSGYQVQERVALSKSDRMERGAGIVQDALKTLIGLGFTEPEVQYLIDEQLSLMEQDASESKVLFAAAYQEKASLCAGRIAAALQRNIEPVTPGRLAQHHDADLVLAPFDLLRQVTEVLPMTDVMGVAVIVGDEILDHVARLLPEQTLGIVSRYEDALNPISQELRGLTGFGGNVISTTASGTGTPLNSVLKQADFVVYTPSARRILSTMIEGRPAAAIRYTVAGESLDQLKERVRG